MRPTFDMFWRARNSMPTRNPMTTATGFLCSMSIAVASPALSDPREDRALSFYGMPGIVDMPNAASMADGDLATSIATVGGNLRYNLAFQISPRITGAFRYAYFGDADDPFSEPSPYWDRSFDLHLRVIDEAVYRPAVAIGLRDFIGTGLYSGEYIVASKTLPRGIRATAGIGWGRFAGRNTFDNPIGPDTRPILEIGEGGTADFDQFFRGPAALFGGLEWAATDKLSFAIEYTSDDYSQEEERFNAINPRSPWNVSASYQLGERGRVAVSYMQGDAIGLQYTFALNPKRSFYGSGLDTPPLTFIKRTDPSVDPDNWTTDWVNVPNANTILTNNASAKFAQQGLRLLAFKAEARRVTVEFENPTYGQLSQAIGRAARALAEISPPSVETFVLRPIVKGQLTSETILRRSDLEALAFDVNGSSELLKRTTFRDAGADLRLPQNIDIYPRFTWALGPYLQSSLFDPENPFLADVGAELRASYEPAPGLLFSGALRQKVAGNLADTRIPQNYPDDAPDIVRSDAGEFAQFSDLTINHLTADYFFRPGENLYGRVSAGYLERMYGGLSTELLWKDPGQWLALGVELNYAQKRDYDQRFGFQDYSVWTGHVSGYFDLGGGYHGQVDVGRYLARDWGATFRLAREFDNGWSVGAYATLTDVPFEAFGEGSFDKGIEITIPLDWFLGQPTRASRTASLRPITRDGGARLNVRNRLYENVRETSAPDLVASWGRFWR